MHYQTHIMIVWYFADEQCDRREGGASESGPPITRAAGGGAPPHGGGPARTLLCHTEPMQVSGQHNMV